MVRCHWIDWALIEFCAFKCIEVLHASINFKWTEVDKKAISEGCMTTEKSRSLEIKVETHLLLFCSRYKKITPEQSSDDGRGMESWLQYKYK